MEMNEGKIDRGLRFIAGALCLTSGLIFTQLEPAFRFFLFVWCLVFFLTAFFGY